MKNPRLLMASATLLLTAAGLVCGPEIWATAETAPTLNVNSGPTREVSNIQPASGRQAFSQPTATLSTEEKLDFAMGKALFERPWIAAPSSTRAADGLGPLYNARSCVACHRHNGRGRPTQPDGRSDPSLILRLSVPAQDSPDTQPEPSYGWQLQTFAVPGLAAEGHIEIVYQAQQTTLSDGEVVTLQRPIYRVAQLSQGPMLPGTQTSPRLAPQLIGMGLLEAIDVADLESLADPDDANGDGISGRLNWVWSPQARKQMPGRFGWKAGMAGVDEQVQNAFTTDLGLSTPSHPKASGDCTERQSDCLHAPNGNSKQFENLEAHSEVVDLTVHYTRHLAVPAARNSHDPAVVRGKRLFQQSECTACHQPQLRTHEGAAEPALSNRLIAPYTDLLLHDMGEGLADHRPEGLATGREWRTAPLWGIGLSTVVNGNRYYLHDGRARSLLEAILWHGGEAEASRNLVASLSKSDRADLLRFIESL